MLNRLKLRELMPVVDYIVAMRCKQTSCPDVNFRNIMRICNYAYYVNTLCDQWLVWVDQNISHNALLIVVKNSWDLAAIYVGPDFVGDRWQHFRLQFGLNVVNLEYLTIYICAFDPSHPSLSLTRLRESTLLSSDLIAAVANHPNRFTFGGVIADNRQVPYRCISSL